MSGGISLGETGPPGGCRSLLLILEGSITGVEEDPRFAFIAKAMYGIRYSLKRVSAAVLYTDIKRRARPMRRELN